MEHNGKSSAVESNEDDGEDGSATDYETAPASGLLTNLAVLELLQPRLEQRQQEEDAAPRKSRKRRKSLRHRDWIEEQVVEYIRNSATMQFQSSKQALPLQRRLQQRPRKRKLVSNHHLEDPKSTNAAGANESERTTSLSASSTVAAHMNGSLPLHSDDTKDQSVEETEEETFFDFTEAEAIQIINHAPRELVDLHLLVDDFTERLSERQQEECLTLIQKYQIPLSDSFSANAAANFSTTDERNLLHQSDAIVSDDTDDNVIPASNTVAIKMEEDLFPSSSYLQDDDPLDGDGTGDWTTAVPEDRKPAAR